MEYKPLTVIVGTGALGSCLAKCLASLKYPIGGIMSRHIDRATRLAEEVDARYALTVTDAFPPEVNLVFLCIPDDAIAVTSEELARGRLDWEGIVVAHTSGALSSGLLQPFASKGASTMSFHPVQTFSSTSTTSFEGIYVGLEGDSAAIEMGRQVVQDLGGIHLVLSTADKTPYHLASTIVSNFFVTLVCVACDLLESIGMERKSALDVLAPLIRQTTENVTTSLPETVLTGPASRGDMNTLRHHAKTLQSDLPHFRPIYLALAQETVRVASRTGRITSIQASRLIAELEKV